MVVITSKWHSAYPNNAHEKRGKEVGLPAASVEAIIAGLPTSFQDAREQVVYEVAMALANVQLVPQGLYDRAVKLLGHASITDMIVLMGYYTCVSLTMNFYAVPAGSLRAGALTRTPAAPARWVDGGRQSHLHGASRVARTPCQEECRCRPRSCSSTRWSRR